MLSTAESANVGLSQVLQLFAPPTNPAILKNKLLIVYRPFIEI